MAEGLLIIPYGIETFPFTFSSNTPAKLLIVPYGIETNRAKRLYGENPLLIVPYGIETKCRT